MNSLKALLMMCAFLFKGTIVNAENLFYFGFRFRSSSKCLSFALPFN